MRKPRINISTVTIEVPVAGEQDPAIVALGDTTCTIWCDDRCAAVYAFKDSLADHPFAERFGYLSDIPHFEEIFRYVAEQHALNRGNPLGAFLEKAATAMETVFARRTGSCVYFAEASGAVKIGWSTKVATRLAQLQTGSPDPITLLGAIPGGRALERQLHTRFAAARRAGEWFDATPELMAYIAGATT